MYITTFYSYKGGVGRTLALANMATQMVRWGRRVLLVDFDLEAPGLDTFELLRPHQPTPGIVEYVSDYIAQREAPDVAGYVYEVTLPERRDDPDRDAPYRVGGPQATSEANGSDTASSPGRLWIMPAGRRDESYASLLHSIDWSALYAEHDGYLMFEDLKEQWRHLFKPDYVLVDSRTGHTDVGGICTRQLPDAVGLFFFPNEQNLRGLQEVVRDIREEQESPRNKSILLHFVMSNVPDIDDEDRILSNRLNEFRLKLNLQRRPNVIHHYNSLALLNQTIFCEERPRSRLAVEYRRLARDIILNNAKDQEGALWFSRDQLGEERRDNDTVQVRNRLDAIVAEHPRNGDILTQVATVLMQQGAHDEARSILERAIAADVSSPDILLNRAQCRLLLLGDRKGAALDAIHALSRHTILESDAYRAISILRQSQAEGSLHALASFPGILGRPPEGRIHIAHSLQRSLDELHICVQILRGVIEDPKAREQALERARSELAVALIGLGDFDGAMLTISPTTTKSAQFGIQDAFNYAMAKWGVTGEYDVDLFREVVNLDVAGPAKAPVANYAQCLALANWAVGNIERANQFLERARGLLTGWQFSCWRYLQVSPKDFTEDLKMIRQLIAGDRIVPEFIVRKRTTADLLTDRTAT
jgi:cellulose biosynthesis protein BcsQ